MAFIRPVLLPTSSIRQLSKTKCNRSVRYAIFRMQETPPIGGGDSRSGSNDNKPPPSSGGFSGSGPTPEPPDGKTITQALEMSFRNVWIKLMTSGIGKEYNDAIIAFALTVISSYKAGYSINALLLELRTNEKANIDIVGLADQDLSLNESEKQTRLIWISLIYLTMLKTKLEPARKIPSVKDELRGTSLENMLSGLSSLVDSVFEAERKGYNLQSFKMELAMQKDIEKSEQITQSQANIRSQWSRIVFSTLELLPESLKR